MAPLQPRPAARARHAVGAAQGGGRRGFTDTQIGLTNLVPGAFRAHTAAGLQFTSSLIGNVSIDASNSARFAPGSVLGFTEHSILRT